MAAAAQVDRSRRCSTILVHARVEIRDRTDSTAVPERLGSSSCPAIGTYRSRDADFPRPVIDIPDGAPPLRPPTDVEAWSHSDWGS